WTRAMYARNKNSATNTPQKTQLATESTTWLVGSVTRICESTTRRKMMPKTPIGRSRRCARDSAAMSRRWSLATSHFLRESSELRNSLEDYRSSIARNAPRLHGQVLHQATVFVETHPDDIVGSRATSSEQTR